MSKQERAVRTRKLLIASAARAFYEHGYTRTSLTAVSSRVGVSSGALYFHFENKAALASAVETEASTALRAVTRRACHSRDSSLQALIDTTHGLAELLRTSVIAKAGFQLSSDDFEGARVNLRQEWRECVQRLLDGAAQERALGPGLRQQVAASSIVAATVGFEVLSRTDRSWLSRESITGFWQHQLPCLASPDVAGRLDPAGTDPAGWDPADAGPADTGLLGAGRVGGGVGRTGAGRPGAGRGGTSLVGAGSVGASSVGAGSVIVPGQGAPRRLSAPVART